MRHPERMPAVLRFTGEDKDLTLDEIERFVETARRAGVPKGNVVRAELSTSGKVKELTIALDDDED